MVAPKCQKWPLERLIALVGSFTHLVLLQIAEPIKVWTRVEERPSGCRMVVLEDGTIVV